MHVRKFNLREAGHMFTHYERGCNHYSNEDIDTEKSHLNYNLAPDRAQSDYLRNMLNKINHANRKDLVVMCDYVVQVPKDLDPALHYEFFKLAYDFFNERYGKIAGFDNFEDICISAYLHFDEKGENHMHYSFMPIKADENGSQRFIAKEVLTRTELKSIHRDFEKYLNNHNLRCKILNGSTRFDSNGRALSVRELKEETRNREREQSREITRRRW